MERTLYQVFDTREINRRLGLTSVGCAGWEGFAAAQPNTTAVAAAGTFVGYVANGTRTWRGIPYAQPPVGNLRWRKTAPAAPLTAPLETKAFRADCAQIGPGWASLGGMELGSTAQSSF